MNENSSVQIFNYDNMKYKPFLLAMKINFEQSMQLSSIKHRDMKHMYRSECMIVDTVADVLYLPGSFLKRFFVLRVLFPP